MSGLDLLSVQLSVIPSRAGTGGQMGRAVITALYKRKKKIEVGTGRNLLLLIKTKHIKGVLVNG